MFDTYYLGGQAHHSPPYQAADERLHGVEPDRAGQDEPGSAQATQRLHLTDPWSQVGNTETLLGAR